MKPSLKRFNPWPVAIIAWFGVCIPAAVGWVVFASSQRTDLVRADYYEHELRYQQQFDRMNRTQAFAGRIAVRCEPGGRQITVALPPEHAAQLVSGRVHFYRPSDARLDFQAALAVSVDGLQRFDARTMPAGLWKVRVEWQVGGDEYLFEQAIVVDPAVPPNSESRIPKSGTTARLATTARSSASRSPHPDPLTRKRERPEPPLMAQDVRRAEGRSWLLPLPGGEGRGEISPMQSRCEPLNREAPPLPSLSPALSGGEGGRRPGEGEVHGEGGRTARSWVQLQVTGRSPKSGTTPKPEARIRPEPDFRDSDFGFPSPFALRLPPFT